MQQSDEHAVVFACGNVDLVGIVHVPKDPASTGVIIITGGPQYRVGSHRQFLLLARRLADDGFAVMRFDYRGMGDSGGESVEFDGCESDIRVAIDAFYGCVPELRDVALWGLCDAASAAMMYASKDTRVTGLVLLNPWARTEIGQAQTLLKHYYVRRLMSADFWRDLFCGRLAVGRSLRSFAGNVRQASTQDAQSVDSGSGSYIERMRAGMESFRGKSLCIMSGDDLTAAEFQRLVDGSKAWKEILTGEHCEVRELTAANHTFSSSEWRHQVEDWTSEWVRQLC